jgi:hypothetical protein
MVKKINIKILFLFLLSNLFLFDLGFSTSLMLDSYSTVPSIIKPGTSVDLTLRVKNVVSSNEDPIYSYVLELTGKNDLIKENILIEEGTSNLGRLGANEYWNAIFKFKVLEGAPSGNYDFNVKIKKYLDGNFISSTVTSFSLVVSGNTFFILEKINGSLKQGESSNFSLSLKNVGGADAGDVKLTLENSEEIGIIGSNFYYFDKVGTLEDKRFNVKFHAKEGIPFGVYSVPVTLKYQSGENEIIDNFNFGILINGDVNLEVASIVTTPKEIRPGNNYVLIEIYLENSGEDTIKSVSAVPINDLFKSSYSDGNLGYLGRINAGEKGILRYYFDIPKNIKSGEYFLNLNVSYQDLLNNDYFEVLKVPLYIKEKPILELSQNQIELNSGSTGKIEFEIKNVGEEKAEEVDIRLIKDSSLPLEIEERSVYIGGLDPNESKKVIFTIKTNSDINLNDYKIRALIRARGDSEVGDNNIYTFNRYIAISVNSRPFNLISSIGFIFGLILIVFLIKKKLLTKIKNKN